MELSSSAERVERERKLAFHRRASVSSPLGGGLEIASRILWRSRHMWPLPTRHPVPSTRQLVISTPTPAAVFLPGRGGLGPRERERALLQIAFKKQKQETTAGERRRGQGRGGPPGGPGRRPPVCPPAPRDTVTFTERAERQGVRGPRAERRLKMARLRKRRVKVWMVKATSGPARLLGLGMR